MAVTFANIQNIAISQRPIQRALGIADLRVDTAGGGAVNESKHPGQNLHTAWFRGVNNASEVRQVNQPMKNPMLKCVPLVATLSPCRSQPKNFAEKDSSPA